MSFEDLSNTLLQWTIRGAGLLWLVGAFMLFRQIRGEMALDRVTAQLEAAAAQLREDSGDKSLQDHRTAEQAATDTWTDRDDSARRGWIAAQAVVLAATSLAMILLHPFASWMAALLVLGQGVYFFWREHTARHAPSVRAADHARPSKATVNAGWVSLAVALLVWIAAYRDLLH